ncbi:MAG: RNA polymerase sigma factor SigJ [Myxococcales bacterium]|nr:RNA polymerase sigma factor SigJ [Myxococcales bacterium]
MDTQSQLFEQHRRMMFGVAYRILGSIEESEDVVQEAWLRWHRAKDIHEPAAWLSRVVGRLALDVLRSAYKRRESYIGPWLPEPIETDDLGDVKTDPVRALILRDAASTAFLRMMDCLSPSERVAFVMRQVFEHSYVELAEILERSEEACRQLVSRAIRKLGVERPPVWMDEEKHQMLLFSFMQALQQGDIAALQQVLSEEVTLYSDGGGEVLAARRPLFGSDHVMRFCLGIVKKGGADLQPSLISLNGATALLLMHDEQPFLVLSLACQGDKILEIQMLRSPSKLTRVCERLFPPFQV